MALLAVKLGILFGLLFTSIAAAVVPLIITRTLCLRRFISLQRITNIMDLSQGFGGGVLLGGGLLHLMAQAQEQIPKTLKLLNASDSLVQFPWSPLLMCISLGSIYFVENILTALVKTILERQSKKKELLLDANDHKTDTDSMYHNMMNASSERVLPQNAMDEDFNNTQQSIADLHSLNGTHDHKYEESHGHTHGDVTFSDLGTSSSRIVQLITVIVLWFSISAHVRTFLLSI